MFYELYCNYNIPILMVYSCGSINHVVVFTKLYIYDDTYGKVNKLPINEFIQMYHIENIVCMYTYIKKEKKSVKCEMEKFNLQLENYCIGHHSDNIEYIGILKKIDSLHMGIIKLINYNGCIGVCNIRKINKYEFLLRVPLNKLTYS